MPIPGHGTARTNGGELWVRRCPLLGGIPWGIPGEGGALPQLQRPPAGVSPPFSPVPSEGEAAVSPLELRRHPSETIPVTWGPGTEQGTSCAPQGTRQGQACPWGDRDLTAGPCTPPAATALQTAGTCPQTRPCHRGRHDGPQLEQPLLLQGKETAQWLPPKPPGHGADQSLHPLAKGLVARSLCQDQKLVPYSQGI